MPEHPGRYPGVLLPPRFFDVRYNGAAIPQDGRRDLSAGANCQLFAYALLAANGRNVPDFRSSELWADEAVTARISELEPLDLLLFHDKPDAYGAHIAVYLGRGEAIHLSKHEGRPVIWPLERFAQEPRYAVFVGAKRVCS